ncbi:hypothetical protein J6590_026446 [Homalodisca vitripennis]|nr:hypothetical protein J6590_026446 [Homalodisca vitripennis]
MANVRKNPVSLTILPPSKIKVVELLNSLRHLRNSVCTSHSFVMHFSLTSSSCVNATQGHRPSIGKSKSSRSGAPRKAIHSSALGAWHTPIHQHTMDRGRCESARAIPPR